MPEEIHESVLKADRWSKIVAMFFALGSYLGIMIVTGDALFSMIIAAFSAVGLRIFIPYYASYSYTDAETKNIQDHPVAGNYNHGAAGGSLLVGSAVAVIVQHIEPNTSISLPVGIGVTILSFLVLQRVLPRA